MTPTRIEFELLRNQVEFLSNSFDWVVGGIGIVIAIVLGVVGYVLKQSNSKELKILKDEAVLETKEMIDESFSAMQQKIDDTYRNFDDLIQQRVKDITDKMYGYVDGKHSEMEAIVHEFRNSAEGDIARFYAVTNDDRGFYAQSFNWWLKATCCYSVNDDSDLMNIAISNAKDVLEKIISGDKNNIEKLWERMTQNNTLIDRLAEKHKSEATIIRELMLEKSKLSKKSTDES